MRAAEASRQLERSTERCREHPVRHISALGGTVSSCSWPLRLWGTAFGFCCRRKRRFWVVLSEQTFVCMAEPWRLAPGLVAARVGPGTGELGAGCCRSGLQAGHSVESLPSQPTLSDFSQCYLLPFQEHLFLPVTFSVSLPHTHLKNKKPFYTAQHFKSFFLVRKGEGLEKMTAPSSACR